MDTETAHGEQGPSAAKRINEWIVVIAGILGILVTALAIWGANREGATDEPTAPGPGEQVATTPPVLPDASFALPEDGDEVDSPFRARGDADLPGNHSLWILTRPEDNRYYTVNSTPLTIDPEDEWQFSMGIGRGPEDAGRQYDLFLVTGITGETEIDTALRDRGDQNTVSFGSLPEGVTVLDHVRVELAG